LEGARTDEDIFMGPSQKQPRQRVFGGQVLAQSLVAGSRTVPDGRGVHSMHGYFLRPGDANKPITFCVQRLRDGRSFSARRVHAYQEGMPILSMIASFQDEDEGIEHQTQMPAGIPDPESLPSTAVMPLDAMSASCFTRSMASTLATASADAFWLSSA